MSTGEPERVRFEKPMTLYMVGTDPPTTLDSVEFRILDVVEARIGARFTCEVVAMTRKIVEREEQR